MSAAKAVKKLVVCGGNGFLGSRICKYAVERGWDVTSISRSGAPNWSSITSSPSPPSWSRKVTWERANLLHPVTYTALLSGTNAVVHSMGILLEADYKGVLQGRESPISGLKKAFATHPPSNNDPQQLTYERMNRDSALWLAAEASKAGVDTFVYISAAGGAPMLPSRYIGTKREAEKAIQERWPEMRSVFVRAPFMYDSSRPLTVPLAAMSGVGSLVNGLTRGVFAGFMGAGAVKPLKVEDVGRAVVEAIEDGDGKEGEGIRGPLEVPMIEELSNRGWRKGMW